MKSNFIAGLVLAFVLPSITQADDGLGYQGKSNDGLSPQELLLKLRSDGETQIREERSWIVATSEKFRTVWSFPPEGHSAYPSYVRREVIEKDGAVYIETSVKCGASKPQCDKLVKDFIELNNRVQNEFKAE